MRETTLCPLGKLPVFVSRPSPVEAEASMAPWRTKIRQNQERGVVTKEAGRCHDDFKTNCGFPRRPGTICRFHDLPVRPPQGDRWVRRVLEQPPQGDGRVLERPPQGDVRILEQPPQGVGGSWNNLLKATGGSWNNLLRATGGSWNNLRVTGGSGDLLRWRVQQTIIYTQYGLQWPP